jgi:hypothetical protein
MGFYLISPLVTLIPLGSISSWIFKPYCDNGLLDISPTLPPLSAATCEWRFHMDGFAYPFWFSPLRLLFLPPSAVGTSYSELHCYGGVDFPKQGAVRQGHVGMLQLATCKKLASASRCWSLRWGVAALVHWSNARSATASRSSACLALLRDGEAEHRLPDGDQS